MKAALVGALAVMASCSNENMQMRLRTARVIDARRLAAEQEARPKEGAAPVVLLTVDGARWQEIFLGTDPHRYQGKAVPPRALLPNLYRLASERGALVGSPGRGVIKASGPNYVSLPGYTEILTGRTPLRCQDNDCPPVTTPTLLDEVYARGGKVAAFASWEKLERALTVAPHRFPVSCGRGDDPTINPYPGGGDYRPDAITAPIALRYLEKARPDVLFLGLGDPDEYAHHDDYPGYLRALTYADNVIGQLFDVLDRMGDRGQRTSVFVTADHGRASTFRHHGGFAPESARVWLFAAGPTIAVRGRLHTVDEHRLADVAPTLRVLMKLDADDAQEAGHPIQALFASPRESQVATRPTGHDTPSPPSPQ